MTGSKERVRYMRLVVFFDLPVETAAQRKEYRIFRKYLINEGYLMLQKSVYAKLVINDASAASAVVRLRANKPACGVVQVLKVTEKQYASMEYVTGSRGDYEELDDTEELVVL